MSELIAVGDFRPGDRLVRPGGIHYLIVEVFPVEYVPSRGKVLRKVEYRCALDGGQWQPNKRDTWLADDSMELVERGCPIPDAASTPAESSSQPLGLVGIACPCPICARDRPSLFPRLLRASVESSERLRQIQIQGEMDRLRYSLLERGAGHLGEEWSRPNSVTLPTSPIRLVQT